ncbi:MAG: YvcK family protein, partial [Deltaproteobacteria bacterium]|nr:YvcK family protein [Deltaproteobacteria bacterium]
NILRDVLWDNRDISPAHLACFKGARVIPAAAWNRSTEWDNVLGYYDPQDRLLKIHSHLSTDPVELRGNLLIALGESLLGRYIESRRWIALEAGGPWGWRSYEIRLRPPRERGCLLSPAQLHTYLRLARMVPDPGHAGIYRITLNNTDGFIPPGLLFGLMYAWYLDNTCAPIMENEMSMLHWHEATLIPHQVQEYRRKKALIHFFRTEIFGYKNIK